MTCRLELALSSSWVSSMNQHVYLPFSVHGLPFSGTGASSFTCFSSWRTQSEIEKRKSTSSIRLCQWCTPRFARALAHGITLCLVRATQLRVRQRADRTQWTPPKRRSLSGTKLGQSKAVKQSKDTKEDSIALHGVTSAFAALAMNERNTLVFIR